MRKLNIKTKTAIVANCLLSLVLLSGCENSVYWKEKHGKFKEFFVDYEIQSIRVDDDSEYHIVAVSKSGNVKTLNDMNNYSIVIKYGEYKNAHLRVKFTDLYTDSGQYMEIGTPFVYLPFGYKVETFDD